ncbi:hypothetical protein C8R44DRAFT_892748 [Mycena epipterygia]|nr:hypothetical protein C8R44DRAFT_892748 [Mycena epipterygia]
MSTLMANTNVADSTALLVPFLADAHAVPGVTLLAQRYVSVSMNNAMAIVDDVSGVSMVLGSLLIQDAALGTMYQQLLDGRAKISVDFSRSCGQVTAKANISSAINPAWRTAKTHIILETAWTNVTSLADIATI